MCPVAGKIRVSGSAQAPSVPLNISPSVVLRTPCADLRSACHGGEKTVLTIDACWKECPTKDFSRGRRPSLSCFCYAAWPRWPTIAINRSCLPHPTMPPWHADFNRRGLAKPDHRGNIQGDGWRLRRSGHANFPCHGGTQRQCRLPVLST